MSSPFAPVTIAELEARLQARRRTALELAGRWRAEADAALDDLDVSDLLDADTPDSGSNDADRARALGLAAVAATAAHSADVALARLAEGRYGTCDRCGTRIPLERLRAMPDATTCINCKRASERPLARIS